MLSGSTRPTIHASSEEEEEEEEEEREEEEEEKIPTRITRPTMLPWRPFSVLVINEEQADKQTEPHMETFLIANLTKALKTDGWTGRNPADGLAEGPADGPADGPTDV